MLQEVFGRNKVALPVLHVRDIGQALRNIEVALEGDADGVFLIDHSGNSGGLIELGELARQEFPGTWFGVNFLGERLMDVWDLLGGFDGVWVDNAQIDENSTEQVFAQKVLERRRESGWEGLYFGGVAFKYQRPVVELERAGALAAGLVDIPTTSGEGTGRAADLSKIERIRAGIGDGPLGIASGISVDNVELYLPLVDAFLVASAICTDFHNFDPVLLADLVAKIHA